MTDKAKLAALQARGEHAERLRDDPMLKEFFESIDAAAINAIRNSAPDECGLRERAYYQLEALENMKLCFQRTVADGKFAEKELRLKEAGSD